MKSISPSNDSESYSEYAVGEWRILPLWNQPGTSDDGQLYEHPGAAEPSHLGRQMPAVNALIDSHFSTSTLKCARLFRASHGALILPHRYFLEHEDGFTRIHVPLITGSASLNGGEAVRFHMRAGEVRYFGARRIHCDGVLGADAGWDRWIPQGRASTSPRAGDRRETSITCGL